MESKNFEKRRILVQHRQEVDQLRREACIDRIKVKSIPKYLLKAKF